MQKFTPKDVEIISSEPVYLGFFKMLKVKFRHKLFAGGWSGVIEREIFERGHAVAVLPYDPQLQEFVFIEQMRMGALATSGTPWLLECVAGMIDKDETPQQVAIRETYEEAGLEVLSLHQATSYLSSPGGTTERMYVYIAKVDATQAAGIHGLEHEGEDILVHRVKEQKVSQLLQQGKIDNAATVIALQWFLLNKKSLIHEWQE